MKKLSETEKKPLGKIPDRKAGAEHAFIRKNEKKQLRIKTLFVCIARFPERLPFFWYIMTETAGKAGSNPKLPVQEHTAAPAENAAAEQQTYRGPSGNNRSPPGTL